MRTNADTPEDAIRARILGAQGVGLCRTEHMFLGERRAYVERLVLAENEDVQRGVIAEMEPLQRADFVGIMMAMSGLPVTIRVDTQTRASSQGASDLVMNLSGAGGGALAGVIIGTLSYGWLCFISSIPISILAMYSIKMSRASRKSA